MWSQTIIVESTVCLLAVWPWPNLSDLQFLTLLKSDDGTSPDYFTRMLRGSNQKIQWKGFYKCSTASIQRKGKMMALDNSRTSPMLETPLYIHKAVRFGWKWLTSEVDFVFFFLWSFSFVNFFFHFHFSTILLFVPCGHLTHVFSNSTNQHLLST